MEKKDKDIIIGDLNSYADPLLDFASSSPSPKNNTGFMQKLIKNRWIDTFRIKYPEKKSLQ